MGTRLEVGLPRQAAYEIRSIESYTGLSVFLPQFSGIQIAYYVFRILWSLVARLVVPNFSTLSHKIKIFGEKFFILMCFSPKICPKHFSFQAEFSVILSQMLIGVRVKYRLFLSEFGKT